MKTLSNIPDFILINQANKLDDKMSELSSADYLKPEQEDRLEVMAKVQSAIDAELESRIPPEVYTEAVYI